MLSTRYPYFIRKKSNLTCYYESRTNCCNPNLPILLSYKEKDIQEIFTFYQIKSAFWACIIYVRQRKYMYSLRLYITICQLMIHMLTVLDQSIRFIKVSFQCFLLFFLTFLTSVSKVGATVTY